MSSSSIGGGGEGDPKPFVCGGASSTSSSSVGRSSTFFLVRPPDDDSVGVLLGRRSCEVAREVFGVCSTLFGVSSGGPNLSNLRALPWAGCDAARVVGVDSAGRLNGDDSGPTDRLGEPPMFVDFRGEAFGGGSRSDEFRAVLSTSSGSSIVPEKLLSAAFPHCHLSISGLLSTTSMVSSVTV